MIHHFDNLVQAISEIQSEGYLIDLENLPLNKIGEIDFEEIETVFIEGNDSSAETTTMLYLIRTKNGENGFLISPHSIYKDDKIEKIESILTLKIKTNGDSN